MPARLVYLKESEYKAFKSLITAKFCGTEIDAAVFDPKKDSLEHNPWKRLPYLETEGGVIANSNAIARYIGRTRPDTNLFGTKFTESCQVDSWMEFCTREVEVPAGVLVWSHQKMIDAPAQGVLDTAVADLTGALSCMETQLGKTKFIVGKEVSLADIALVCSLLDVFKLLLGASYRGNFPKLSAWFATCTQLPQFQAVLGSRIALCSSSNLNFAPLVRTLTSGSSSSSSTSAAAAGAATKKSEIMNRASTTGSLGSGVSSSSPEQASGTGGNKKNAAAAAKPPAPAAKAASAPPPAPAGAPAGGSSSGPTKGTPEELAALQAAKDRVRELKTAGAEKADVEAAVAEMKRLKEVCGEVDPPKKKKK